MPYILCANSKCFFAGLRRFWLESEFKTAVESESEKMPDSNSEKNIGKSAI